MKRWKEQKKNRMNKPATPVPKLKSKLKSDSCLPKLLVHSHESYLCKILSQERDALTFESEHRHRILEPSYKQLQGRTSHRAQGLLQNSLAVPSKLMQNSAITVSLEKD